MFPARRYRRPGQSARGRSCPGGSPARTEPPIRNHWSKAASPRWLCPGDRLERPGLIALHKSGAQKCVDRLPSFFVRGSGNHSARLVEHEINPGGGCQRPAIDFDTIVLQSDRSFRIGGLPRSAVLARLESDQMRPSGNSSRVQKRARQAYSPWWVLLPTPSPLSRRRGAQGKTMKRRTKLGAINAGASVPLVPTKRLRPLNHNYNHM